MARNFSDIVTKLPAKRRFAVEAQQQALCHPVESLRELRQIAGKAQADVASALKIKQPSVSKIENQADMYLSTLRSYVEAVGGKLELVVKLPHRRAVRLQYLGDMSASAVPATPKPHARRRVAVS